MKINDLLKKIDQPKNPYLKNTRVVLVLGRYGKRIDQQTFSWKFVHVLRSDVA